MAPSSPASTGGTVIAALSRILLVLIVTTLGVALAAPAAQSSDPDDATAQIAKKCKKKHRGKKKQQGKKRRKCKKQLAPAAPPPEAPVLTATEGAAAVMVGGSQKEHVPITVTVTRAADQGFALIRIPHQTGERSGQAFDWAFGMGDGPTPQTTDSVLSGYVRISNDSSCASAALEPVMPIDGPSDDVEIEVSYSCEAGQDFTLDYYPRIDYLDFDPAFGAQIDQWTFTLSRRSSQAKPWTQLSSQPLLQVSPVVIEQPNILFDAPPQSLVAADIVVEIGIPHLVLTTEGTTDNGTKIQSTIDLGEFVALDQNGQPFSLDITNNPNAVDALVSHDQPPLVVTDCIQGVCVGDPFGSVAVIAPPGIFTFSGSGYSGPVFGMISAAQVDLSQLGEAERYCVSDGGTFDDGAATSPNGGGPVDWICFFPPGEFSSTGELVAARDFFARFCVSSTTVLEVDYSGGGGADAIWCYRSLGPI